MTTEYIGIYIGIIGIILGALISLYFYRRSIRLKEPYWSIISNNLIEGYSTKVENLKVIYKGEEVNNLTISRILFWNGGRETLEKKDIETVNRIRITGKKGVKIFRR